MTTAPFPYEDQPYGVYYRHQNPGAADATDGMSRWKYASSRKATAIATWEKRERARLLYERRYGPDPDGWPVAHPTTVVWPTNAPEAVCLGCLWIDGSHWTRTAARAAADTHTRAPADAA